MSARQAACGDGDRPAHGHPGGGPGWDHLRRGDGLSFTGYSEDLPAPGSTVETTGPDGYQRKHNPWVNFDNVPPEASQPFSAFANPLDPLDYGHLPDVAIVVPNQAHDMHNGTIAEADAWLAVNVGPYVDWAQDHQSLFILTFDEDDSSTVDNHIFTLLVGPMIVPGLYDQPIDHYNLLRTIEDFYGLAHAGGSAGAVPLTSAAFEPVPESSTLPAGFTLAGLAGWTALRRTRVPTLSGD